ncbi:MAG: methylenetetrahydrofolate--tRNA-(uracil(54)-C(5))-methyltransferase (FADH(2)-oxidizing) TrmFO [Clostridiales bacterium]|nr:methylenetetrahydrofolate--tRNA-(uracil(54)-C(5))-methyltransferase (FADH(2)-oxidizing) TrmFO [Clostridiales bacterium]
MNNNVIVIGAGLAGCEASLQLAKRNISVTLYEMKPNKKSEAHKLDEYAELVCSNSLKSITLTTSSGVLKEEMALLDSFILKTAKQCKVPAGNALAVDRYTFSKKITSIINDNPLINVINEEIKEIPSDQPVIIATGPLSSEDIINSLGNITGKEQLYFFDAAAPIIREDSLDHSIVYKKARYNKGEADYFNCSMNREQYFNFYNYLISADTVILHDFEKKHIFEGCMPIEIMAKRGIDTLRFGPLKPVGLDDNAYAVVQLRQDNESGTLYNLVGFQTNLTFKAQKELLKLIPGLENVVIERNGVMHRNTYLNSPKLLNEFSQLNQFDNIFIAGQLSGVEGYMESALSGLVCGINMARKINNNEMIKFPLETMTGALLDYITNAYQKKFQPMNSNFGIIAPLETRERNKTLKKEKYSKRAIESMKKTIKTYLL